MFKTILECEWGKMYLVKDETGEFNGESAPLWINASPTCFIFQSFWGSK